MKKIQGQERSWVRAPPTTRPTALPPMAIAAQTPSAFARSAPSWKVVVMMASAAGEMNAAPKPWSARDPISIPELVASPSRSEAAVKTTRPKRNSLLRPSRSPARPPSRRKPPKTRVYAFTIHCRFASDRPRSFWIEGSATFTTVASSTTMNWAKQTRTRISQGFVPWRLIGPLPGLTDHSAQPSHSSTTGNRFDRCPLADLTARSPRPWVIGEDDVE